MGKGGNSVHKTQGGSYETNRELCVTQKKQAKNEISKEKFSY